MPAGTSPYQKEYVKVTAATGNRSFAAKTSIQVQNYLQNTEERAIENDG